MRLVCITILTLVLFEARAQQVSQVVEKAVVRTHAVKKGDVLDLRSEKAAVFITRGDPGVVKVKLVFTASHPDRNVAEAEIRFHKYAFGTNGNTFFIQQTYFFRDVTKVLSKLSARIELTIPPDMPVISVGEYTDFTLSNGDGSNNFRMHFGKLILNNVDGPTKVDTSYGDIEINQCAGKIDIVAKRSDILLRIANPITEGFIQTFGNEQIVDTKNLHIKNLLGTIEVQNSKP